MSDTIKPPLHGDDHLPGGQDPIPGLAVGLPWCYAQNLSPGAIADSSVIYVPYSDITIPSGYSSQFATATGAGSQATLQITENGLYWISILVSYSKSTAAAAGAAAWLNLAGSNDQVGGAPQIPFTQRPGFTSYGADVSWLAVINIDPDSTPAPVTINVQTAQSSGISLTTWLSTLSIVQVNPTGSSNF